jgi:hypothetical protein
MYRDNWKDWRFWRWWWHDRVPLAAKVTGGALLAAFLLVGGYFVSGGLTGASAASGSASSYVLQTTVTKIVTVRKNGRTIVRRIPVVVRRTIVHASTAFATSTVVDTRVVTTPGGTRYVVRKVKQYVPVVHQKVVKIHGKTTTVTETRLVPTVKTQTLTNVVTNEQTVTNQSTTVVTKTVTKPVTTTETETHTVTLPPETVTNTQTETDTVTETQTVETTITLPGDTVTVTVTTTAGP